MDATNLTKQLGERATADGVRRSMHRPWLVLLVIAAGIAALMFIISAAATFGL